LCQVANTERVSTRPDLVSPRKQRGRHVEPERLCGLKVDHKLELGPRLYRKVCRVFAIEDAIDVAGRAAKGKCRLLHQSNLPRGASGVMARFWLSIGNPTFEHTTVPFESIPNTSGRHRSA
jgi:hypothetical protein